MSIAVLYFLPTTSADTSPLPDIVDRLTTHYDPSILPRWSLRQRLFRSTPAPRSAADDVPPIPARHLQILSLPDRPNDSLVVITQSSVPSDTATVEAADVISLPAGQSTDDFTQLLMTRLSPLWQQRQLLAVVEGLAYQIGEFRIKAGELRQGVGGAQLVRGVVVEVVHSGEDEGAQDRSQTEDMITAFWDELGVSEAKEFRAGGENKVEDGFEDVRLWSALLMLKG
ncbi:MAG: hypothetical protein Q9169_002331 [Polycauliona sp. 2 TL-2023]